VRVSGFINFVLVTSATACLVGVVNKSNKKDSYFNDSDFKRFPSPVMPTDTPEVEEAPDLPYNFKDNNGKAPLSEPKSNLYLNNPENIKTDVEYNPKTGNYDIKQKIGSLDYRPETYMKMKEYQDYVFKKSMRDYWRSRVAADELNNKPRKGMVPKIQVNSELFDRIFGGNTVDIKPTGTAELIFGLNRNKNFNPAIPQRQQKITNFDFNMRIQLNLIGKIGDKLKVTTNYNTEASFDWENQVKLDYTGYEDEILKKIEAGNVTLPLNSSLISGSQTLFGFKTTMQFGRLTATTVFSQQRGQKKEVVVQGGAQTTPFIVQSDNYENNKHFFLGHYFRDNFDAWMTTLPVIQTPVVITKVEVYISNINGTAEQTRKIAAFEDLGEDSVHVWPGLAGRKGGSLITSQLGNLAIMDNPFSNIPSNEANNLYALMTNTLNGLISDRNIDNVSATLASTIKANNPNNEGGNYMVEGRDFNRVSNARRLNANEFFFNPRTGFISLNQQLNNEQVLGVSYQYTYGGKTYQVGEFSDQVSDNNLLLVCKLLKPTTVSVKHPMWQLMMKNVYSIGAYNLSQQDFKLDVFYNNIETGVDVPYLPFGRVNGQQLIRVLSCDNLSVNGDRRADGVFDFISGYTVLMNNGRIVFPTVEPFGRSLAKKFAGEDFPTANNYIFNELYDSTKTAASFIQNKNRFKLKGSYRSSSGSDISLNALNIPQGAVVVTANGVALIENSDYTVDYSMGRVKIINDGILNSGAQIKVSLESNSLFNVQQKSLWGGRFDYKAGRNLSLGSTILRFNERPLTQKVNFGDEPVSNIVAGFDINYKTDAPFLTRLLDKLPFYSTKEMSTISTRGEIAKLFPGNAKAIGQSGNSYIDDFEGSISLIDVRNPNGWSLSSIPQGQSKLFPEAAATSTAGSGTILTGINRARLNWYTIDPMFTRSQTNTTPSYYNNQIFSNNMWRQVFETELFPGRTPPNGQQVVLPVLDLAFFPTARGPYNYDVKGVNGISSGINQDGSLKDPQNRWGGIMRRLETNDFQAANVEYIQFWMMDPFNEDYKADTDSSFDSAKLPEGDLYINIGNISEDIVKDGYMSYENGLPGTSQFSSVLPVDTTNLAIVPLIPPTINAFSADNGDRASQDVGYDGMDNANENFFFSAPVNDMISGQYSQSAKDAFINDPSSDDYTFFRDDRYDAAKFTTIKRYAKYNNPQGNSPTEAQYQSINADRYSTAGSTIPNIEDINRDNTLSETENYYQYRVHISKDDIASSAVGTNFLVDAFNGAPAEFSGVPSKTVRWYQFKIPISQYENVVGGIEGFNSIRFMRVFMRGFKRPVVLRLARFELVRSDWRRYEQDLRTPGEYIARDNNTTSFDISAVSLQENSTKEPVNYVMPPQISQQQNVQTTNLVLQNEQALQMRVCDLQDGDSRAIFKNVDLDTRMYNNIKMNVHAEKPITTAVLNDGDLNLFFRVGTDYNNNYYEYEVPLKLTRKGVYDPNSTDARYEVWPADNEINFKFNDIAAAKNDRNKEVGFYSNLDALSKPYSKVFSGYTVTIVGNPNLGNVKSVMVGIRNPKNDKLSHCAEVWINELRLTEFNNEGGWATTAQVQAKLADLGNVSLAGTYSTPFWGSVESKIGTRSKETNFNWDMSSSINAGKFLPDKWKITLPVFYNYGQTIVTPLFNPLDPDVRMSDVDNNPAISAELKQKIREQVEDYTERKGFNLSNVRIDGLKRKGAKPLPWDIANFSTTFAFNQISKRSVNVASNINRQYRGNIQYAYSLQNPLKIKPFSKMKIFDNKWFTLIKEFNLQLLPNSFGASLDLTRSFAQLQNRDITSFYSGSSDFVNPILYNKNFVITRSYNLRWDLNKAIKFDYTANNDGRVLEPYGDVSKKGSPERDSVIANLRNGGTTTLFHQQMNLTVAVPINKIPIFDFVSSLSYRYGGSYTWTRMPFAIPDSLSIGNTIQNTNTHNVNASLSMTTLYNKIPYFKRLNSPKANQPAPLKGKTKISPLAANGQKGDQQDSVKKKPKKFMKVVDFLARTLMMVKSVSGTLQKQGGQGMPNFKPSSQYVGMDASRSYAPGFLFTAGLYDANIRQRSDANGWLVKTVNQTTPYTELDNINYSYRAAVEPHSTIKVDLTGTYNKQKSRTEYMVLDSTGRFDYFNSPNETGNFDISTFTFFRSFQDGNNPVNSNLFNEFLADRSRSGEQLANANSNSTKVKTKNGIDGYSNNQQDVLIGSFYKTYTGRSIKNYGTKNLFPTIPLPNWTISWDGLGKVKALTKTFRSITIRHGYRSNYRVSSYTNNILYNTQDPSFPQDVRAPVTLPAGTNTTVTEGNNFVPFYNINSVTISEAFSPLLKFDLQFVKTGLSANIETRRDKTTTMNVTGLQIIETKGQEYILGAGYMIQKLKIPGVQIQGKQLESNLILKLDLSYRKNLSVIRNISEGQSVPTGGTNIITMRSSADYQLTQNINLRIFYDWIKTTPQTSASFPTSSATGGFSLRINFQ
jgi:cell surface protein SprA